MPFVRVRGPMPGLAAKFFYVFGALIRTQPGRRVPDAIGLSTGGFVDFGSLHQEFLSCPRQGSDPEACGLRAGSLPCELRLVARPTVAHTGGYCSFLFVLRAPSTRPGPVILCNYPAYWLCKCKWQKNSAAKGTPQCASRGPSCPSERHTRTPLRSTR